MAFNSMEAKIYDLNGPNFVKQFQPNPQLTMCQTVNEFSIDSNYKYTDNMPVECVNTQHYIYTTPQAQ